MNLDELRATWVAQDEQLSESIRLNKKLLAAMVLGKARSKLRVLMSWRVVEGIIFYIIVVLLSRYVATHFHFTAATISAAILAAFAIIGLLGSIGQIALILQIDYTGSVKTVQAQIYDIRAHGLKVVTLSLLSIPFYMAYIFLGVELLFGVDLYAHLDQAYMLVNIMVSIGLLVATLWFCKKLNSRNKQTGWVRKLTGALGGEQLLVAADLRNELHEIEQT